MQIGTRRRTGGLFSVSRLELSNFSSTDSAFAEPLVTLPPTITVRDVARKDGPSRTISRMLLLAAAIALAGVGIAMNGWFARSLGATEAAGWLFFAVGVSMSAIGETARIATIRELLERG